MRESYPLARDRSSPTPPVLPERPPDRFQFSLAQLLAYMAASAILAAAIRYLLVLVDRQPDVSRSLGLPAGRISFWADAIVGTLAFGAILYLLLRGPFLALHAGRISRRWKSLQAHRRELATWSRERQQELARRNVSPDPPPRDD